jgi:hypothetical protein
MAEHLSDKNSETTSRSKIFAMVTTLKSREYTPHAVKTFFENTELNDTDRFILISNDDPNASTFQTKLSKRLELINNPEPLSFAANVNQMIDLALSTSSDLYFINNDVIFSDNWLAPLAQGDDRTILSPVSNREVQYAGSAVVIASKHVANTMILKAPMELSEYLASPRMFQALAEAHSKTASGYLTLLVFPFFCVKLPLGVMQVVGKFDLSFGRAGGEDYDYALRAWLAGFECQLALGSYLLHFWGRSTWAGGPRAESSYDKGFLGIFEEKWGKALFQFALQENDSAITSDPELNNLRQTGRLGELVRRLKMR